MKRFMFCTAAILVLCGSLAMGEGRADIGFDVPFGLGGIGANSSFSSEASTFFREHILPFPEASVYYTPSLGPVTFGLGMRAYTFILESIVWPNAFAEVSLGPVVFQGQVGGGAFLLFGLYNSFKTGANFFPDLSAWLKLGKTFRIGGGVMGMFLDGIDTSTIPAVFYLGVKAAIKF